MFHDGPRELFQAAATLSAELGSVNAALQAGHDLTGGRLRKPVFWGVDVATWDGTAA